MMQYITKFLVYTQGFSKNFSGLMGADYSIFNGGSLFFLFFILVVFLGALSFGKTRIILALLATYIAAFLESIFWYRPQLDKFFSTWLKLPALFWSHLFVFVFFFVVSFLILNHSILKPKMSLRESPPIIILFLSILQGIFWLSIVVSYLPVQTTLSSGVLGQAGPLVKQYLTLSSAKFAVALFPLLVLLFLKRKKVVSD